MAVAKIAFLPALYLAIGVAGVAFDARLFHTGARHIFQSCNYTGGPVWTCADCHAQLACTIFGGIRKACWWPGTTWCADGKCVSTPQGNCSHTPPDTSTSPSAITTPMSPEPNSNSTVKPLGL